MVLLEIQLLVMLGLLTAGLHWLIARSYVMKWFWGRLSPGGFLDKLVRCPACSGFWLGLLCWSGGIRPLGTIVTMAPIDACATGVLAMAITPIFEGAILWGLAVSAVGDQNEDTGEEKHPEHDTADTARH